MCYNIGRLCGGAAALLGETREGARLLPAGARDLREGPLPAGDRADAARAGGAAARPLPDERAAAIEHLDFAIAEFREMKMQPSLERALRHKEVLKA